MFSLIVINFHFLSFSRIFLTVGSCLIRNHYTTIIFITFPLQNHKLLKNEICLVFCHYTFWYILYQKSELLCSILNLLQYNVSQLKPASCQTTIHSDNKYTACHNAIKSTNSKGKQFFIGKSGVTEWFLTSSNIISLVELLSNCLFLLFLGFISG